MLLCQRMNGCLRSFCSVKLKAIGALVIAAKFGVRLSSLIENTSRHVIVGTLTPKTGPHTGSYSGLYIPDPGGRHMSHECMMNETMHRDACMWTHMQQPHYDLVSSLSTTVVNMLVRIG